MREHTDSSALHTTAAEAFPVISCTAAVPPLMTTTRNVQLAVRKQVRFWSTSDRASLRRRRVKWIIYILYNDKHNNIRQCIDGRQPECTGSTFILNLLGSVKEIKTLAKANVLSVLPIGIHNDLFLSIRPKFGGGSTKNVLSMAFVAQCSMHSQSLLYCIL